MTAHVVDFFVYFIFKYNITYLYGAYISLVLRFSYNFHVGVAYASFLVLSRNLKKRQIDNQNLFVFFFIKFETCFNL